MEASGLRRCQSEVVVEVDTDPQLDHEVGEAEVLGLQEHGAVGKEERDHVRHEQALARLAKVNQCSHARGQDEESGESQRDREIKVDRNQLVGRHRDPLD